MPKSTSTRRPKARTHVVAVNEGKPDQYFSRAVEKGLRAVEELAQSPEGLTLVDAAARLDLTKPSAFRILRTLETLGYVVKTADGRRYTLPATSSRQIAIRSVQSILQHGAEPVRTLSMEFRETASMAGLFENHIEVVLVAESPQIIRMGNTVGRILPPHASSMGKAISAFLDDAQREQLLRSYGTNRFTPTTITDALALRKEFEQIRANGHSEDWEESTPGGVCFGAPILRPDRTAAGALSLSLPKMRLEGEEHQRKIIAAVKRAAAEIASRAFEI